MAILLVVGAEVSCCVSENDCQPSFLDCENPAVSSRFDAAFQSAVASL